MPDSSGKIRGITVPSVPWHGLSDDAAVLLGLGPGGVTEKPLTPVETGVRDADQMLWEKQTDEGPSALEKLRDKS